MSNPVHTIENPASDIYTVVRAQAKLKIEIDGKVLLYDKSVFLQGTRTVVLDGVTSSNCLL